MTIARVSDSPGTRIAAFLFVTCLSPVVQAQLPVDGAWIEIGPPVGDIGGLAADPNDPDLVVAATRTTGTFRSTDGGKTWSRGEPLSFGGSSQSLYADPHHAGVFYAKINTFETIMRSADGGVSWEPLEVSGSVTSMASDPGSADVLYVGTSNSGLFRSGDGGESFVRIDADSGFFSGVRVVSIAVDPLDGSRLLVGTQGQSPGTVRVTFDSGEWSFESINDGLGNPSNATISFDADGEAYASLASTAYHFDESSDTWVNLFDPGGIRHLQADPRHSGILFAAGSAALYRTTTGGGSGQWQQELDEDIDGPTEIVFSETPLLATSGFGVYRRDADSSQSGNWQPSNTGMNAAVVNSVLVDPATPGRYLAGMGGPTLMETVDGGGTWSQIGNGLQAGDPVGNLQASEFVCDRFFATQGDDLYVSDDAGGNWDNLDPNGDVESSIRSLVQVDGTTVLVTTFDSVLIGDLDDPGDVNWSHQVDGLPVDSNLAGVGHDPVADRYYALTRRDGLFQSELDNGQLSWSAVPDQISGSLFFSNIHVDATGRFVFGTTSSSTGRIYRLDLDDPAAEFERVNHDLPGTSLMILFQPGGKGPLVANIDDDGSFYSEDHGETWHPLGQPFPFRLFDLVEDVHNPGQYLAATATASVARLIGDDLFRDRFEGGTTDGRNLAASGGCPRS